MNQSFLPSSVQLTRFRGERLRELRESKGLDLESLAKRLALSPAQLRQLETNQGSLFYSDAIRLATARKVSAFLGETLVLEPAPATAEEQSQGLNAEAQVPSNQRVQPAPFPQSDSVHVTTNQPAPRRVPAGESRLSLSGWGVALWGVALIFSVLLGLQAFSKPEALAPDSAASAAGSSGRESVAYAASSVPAVLVPAESMARVAAAPAAVLPIQASPPTPSVLAAVTPSAVAQISTATPVLAATSAHQAQAAQDCGLSNGPTASFTPAKADKDAAQIFVQGLPGQVVCVKDGRGQVWRHEFSNSAGRSFFGVAPWLVESNQLSELQIYFQGNRARPSLSGATRLRLLAAEPAA